ncbi:MAG: ribonuclease P protein component [Candidatus Paceibacterota bacterium]|jgi:ribonuclease P protein component
MLPKEKRVPRATFSEVFKKGKIIHSPFLTLRFIKKEPENSRFSFVISSSVSKRAVDRNYLKRIGYNIIQNNLKTIKNSYICTFFFKKEGKNLKFKELEKEINFLLNKAGICK